MKKLLTKVVSAGMALLLAVPMAVTAFAAETSGTEAEVTAKFYSDLEMTDEIAAVAGGIYVNGGKVAPDEDEDKIDYKNVTIYTDMESKAIDPDGEGSKPAKQGKITVAVTMSSETPKLEKGKPVKDAEAANILKASYKKGGAVKLTANKAEGKVYVHVLDISINKEIEQAISIPVVVGMASAKVALYDDDGKVAKKGVANVYDIMTLDLKALTKEGEELSNTNFRIILDEKYEDYISCRLNKKKLYVTAEDLNYDKPGKPVSTKVTVMDTKSGKKATYSLSIVDNVDKVFTEISSSEKLTEAKSSVEMDYWIETVAENDITTDKLKLYVCKEGTEPKVGEKNKIVYTKCSDVTAKLSKEGDILTLSTKVAKPSCDIYAVYTDSASKTSQIFQVAFVVDGAVVGIGG